MSNIRQRAIDDCTRELNRQKRLAIARSEWTAMVDRRVDELEREYRKSVIASAA